MNQRNKDDGDDLRHSWNAAVDAARSGWRLFRRLPLKIQMATWTGLVALVVIANVAQPSQSTDSSKTTASPAVTAPEPATTPAPAPEPDVAAAEDAVRSQLPDIPLWDGTKFKGTVTSGSEICVDRIIKKSAAETLGIDRTSHVVVSWPGLERGEPKDGPCAKAEVNADKAIEETKRFYIRMDDFAIQLDNAVHDALNDDPGASTRIAELRKRIFDANTRHLLAGGELSVGGNLLVSVATTARDAARDQDLSELVRQRRKVVDARRKLAAEIVK